MALPRDGGGGGGGKGGVAEGGGRGGWQRGWQRGVAKYVTGQRLPLASNKSDRKLD